MMVLLGISSWYDIGPRLQVGVIWKLSHVYDAGEPVTSGH